MITFPPAGGRGVVTVPPLALGTVVDRTPGVELFQTAPTRLSVRLRPDAGADPERVRAGAREGITAVLTDLGLAHVTVVAAPEPPGADHRRQVQHRYPPAGEAAVVMTGDSPAAMETPCARGHPGPR